MKKYFHLISNLSILCMIERLGNIRKGVEMPFQNDFVAHYEACLENRQGGGRLQRGRSPMGKNRKEAQTALHAGC